MRLISRKSGSEGGIIAEDRRGKRCGAQPAAFVMRTLAPTRAFRLCCMPESHHRGSLSMRLTLQRGAALIAVIAGLGTGTTSAVDPASAGEAEARQFMQAGQYDKAIQELQPLADQ